MDAMAIIAALLGTAQIGLLTGIFFRLGGVTATQEDHDRRIDNLEKRISI